MVVVGGCLLVWAWLQIYDATRPLPRPRPAPKPWNVEAALRHAYIEQDEIGATGFAQLHGWAADLEILGRSVPPPRPSGATTVDLVLDVIDRAERENGRRAERRTMVAL